MLSTNNNFISFPSTYTSYKINILNFIYIYLNRIFKFLFILKMNHLFYLLYNVAKISKIALNKSGNLLGLVSDYNGNRCPQCPPWSAGYWFGVWCPYQNNLLHSCFIRMDVLEISPQLRQITSPPYLHCFGAFPLHREETPRFLTRVSKPLKCSRPRRALPPCRSLWLRPVNASLTGFFLFTETEKSMFFAGFRFV